MSTATRDTPTTAVPAVPADDAVEAARAAQLRYVTDRTTGISRRTSGGAFTYLHSDGTPVTDDRTLARISALAVPPAWTDVWICAIPNGHLQATGRDARGRKQYRYHARWRAVRDEAKYDRLGRFGRALPAIRRRVDEDLGRRGLPKEKLLAAIVRLLETTMIRVGNEEYARTNGSFGLTTLQDRHVEVEGERIRFRFRGKGGKVHRITLNDRRLARIVRGCRELPGQDLFQYLDDEGEVQGIGSGDVNDYLRNDGDEGFTAKDFRTWAGTLLAARGLAGVVPDASSGARRTQMLSAVGDVAERLGNTVAICRRCYVHPAVLDAFVQPEVLELWRRAAARNGNVDGLSPEENALLRFLEDVGSG